MPRDSENGAVVLRTGSRYLTVGSIPHAGSLEIQAIEKLPREWLPGSRELTVGETLAFPLDERQSPLVLDQEAWKAHDFHALRRACAQRDLNPGANPSRDELLESLESVEPEPVGYDLLELAEGIAQAEGPASEHALDLLETQVANFRKKRAVVRTYLEIKDESSPYEEVIDVAEEFGISVRSVHRYVDELITREERITTPRGEQSD